MLKKILRVIQEGKFNQLETAKALDVSPEYLDMALKQLLMLGYLKDEKLSSGCCSTDCKVCSVQAKCNQLTVYTLSDKGRQILKE